jgi:diadenosine tetraphosphate (Ap4A) HIT family hydrolase
MPETAEEFYARALAHADGERRLPVPDQAGWDIFPFEPDSLRSKPLEPLTRPEPARDGEGGQVCRRCADPGDGVAWRSEQWTLSRLPMPLGVPFAAMLESREHLDLGDLDDGMAAELGRIVVRVTRAVEALDAVARVHVNRWGDGGSHLHVWLLGRPAGMVQLRGSCLPIWDDMLPRVPDAVSARTLEVAAAALADLGEVVGR